MIAITSFLPLTVSTFLFAIFATAACTLFTMPGLTSVFEELGMPADIHMPALTGPFVFTTIIFLLSIIAFGHIPGGIGWAKP
jgi:urea transporter